MRLKLAKKNNKLKNMIQRKQKEEEKRREKNLFGNAFRKLEDVNKSKD